MTLTNVTDRGFSTNLPTKNSKDDLRGVCQNIVTIAGDMRREWLDRELRARSGITRIVGSFALLALLALLAVTLSTIAELYPGANSSFARPAVRPKQVDAQEPGKLRRGDYDAIQPSKRRIPHPGKDGDQHRDRPAWVAR